MGKGLPLFPAPRCLRPSNNQDLHIERENPEVSEPQTKPGRQRAPVELPTPEKTLDEAASLPALTSDHRRGPAETAACRAAAATLCTCGDLPLRDAGADDPPCSCGATCAKVTQRGARGPAHRPGPSSAPGPGLPLPALPAARALTWPRPRGARRRLGIPRDARPTHEPRESGSTTPRLQGRGWNKRAN